MTNCSENGGICSLFRFNPTPSSITKSLLKPPENPLYTITPNTSNTQCTPVSFLHSLYDILLVTQYKWIKEHCYLWQKQNNNSIVILYLKNKNKPPVNGFTIVFSHGNKSSLDKAYPFLYDLSTQLSCDVIAYDYTGYGRSNGTPSEEEMKSDINEIGLFTQEQKIGYDEIILLSQSIGSVPSVSFASTNQSILGMILMSPLSSGKKLFLYQKDSNTNTNTNTNGNVIKDNDDNEDADDDNNDEDHVDNDNENPIDNWKKKFNILNKLSTIEIPVFLIHGMLDNIIPNTHSKEIARRLFEVSTWYPKNGTHHNIINTYRDKFYSKLKDFIGYCSKAQIIKIKTKTKYKSKTSVHDSTANSAKGNYNSNKGIITLNASNSYDYDNYDSNIGDSYDIIS